MTKTRNPSWSRRPHKRVHFFAQEVSDMFCHRVGIRDPTEAQRLEIAAFSIGQSLAMLGRPGEWDRIDIDHLLGKLPGGVAFDTTVRDIARLILWLGGERVLPRSQCRRNFRAIKAHARVGDELASELERLRAVFMPTPG